MYPVRLACNMDFQNIVQQHQLVHVESHSENGDLVRTYLLLSFELVKNNLCGNPDVVRSDDMHVINSITKHVFEDAENGYIFAWVFKHCNGIVNLHKW